MAAAVLAVLACAARPAAAQLQPPAAPVYPGAGGVSDPRFIPAAQPPGLLPPQVNPAGAPALPGYPVFQPEQPAAAQPAPGTGAGTAQPAPGTGLPTPGAGTGQPGGTGPLGPLGSGTSSGTGGPVNPDLPGRTPPIWYVIGSDPSIRSYWDNGLWFATANNDWRIHVGGRFQFEPVFWQQSYAMRGTPPGNGGVPASGPGGGVGTLQDGMFFRRVRLRSDGVGYETVEYALEVDFEQLNFITYDHMWFGFKDVPVLGTVRIGQHKVPMGMDNMASDYHLTFLERNVLSEGIWASLFAPGVFIANNFLNNNVSFQTMFHRVQPVNQIFTSDFGGGDYAETTRLTWTPLYKDEGANLVHVGGSYQWRHADIGNSIQPGGTGSTFGDTQNVVRFRARPEMRDAVGVGTGGNLGGDTGRFVDTGYLLASNVHTVSPEFLMITGPFSIQSEAAWTYVENARPLFASPGLPAGTPVGTPMFWGAYVQASYFLTGEHRGYDRRFGVFDRPRVSENFFLVRGEDGRYHFGWGAWEVAYRYSFLDLNSNRINGGQLGQHTVGLNWYFNDNTKVQFQYLNIHRDVVAPAVSGTVHGFGMLAQWYF